MNLLKSLNAKTEVREMLLVDCATKRGTMGHQLKKLRTQRKGGFWGMVAQLMILLAAFLQDWNVGYLIYPPALYLGYSAYVWVASDSKIQLLLLIKHYREED